MYLDLGKKYFKSELKLLLWQLQPL